MEEDNIDARRLTEVSLHQTVSNDLIIRRAPLTKQTDYKKRVRSSKAEYTFLQFHHIIWKWALANHKLKEREIKILLYIYPLITFTFGDFNQALSELSSSDAGTLGSLKKRGWISVWSTETYSTVYVLSGKANTLVSRMHRMFMAEEEIPMSPRRNTIARKKTKKNDALMAMFSKFNSKIKDNDEKLHRGRD